MGKQHPSHAGAMAARALRATYQMFLRSGRSGKPHCGCTTAMIIRCARCREPLEPSPSQLNRAHIAEVAAKMRKDKEKPHTSRMRESRTYGSGRGACHETHVPTATTARIHRAVLLGLTGAILGWARPEGDQ